MFEHITLRQLQCLEVRASETRAHAVIVQLREKIMDQEKMPFMLIKMMLIMTIRVVIMIVVMIMIMIMMVMVKTETRQRKPATTEAFGRRRAVSRSVHSQPSVGKQNQLRSRRRNFS